MCRGCGEVCWGVGGGVGKCRGRFGGCGKACWDVGGDVGKCWGGVEVLGEVWRLWKNFVRGVGVSHAFPTLFSPFPHPNTLPHILTHFPTTFPTP